MLNLKASRTESMVFQVLGEGLESSVKWQTDCLTIPLPNGFTTHLQTCFDPSLWPHAFSLQSRSWEAKAWRRSFPVRGKII